MRALRLGLVFVSLAVAARSDAFCGFFVAGSNEKLTNDASQVALVREGTKTSLTMSNTYKGPPEGFAMVVPVPVVLKKEDVKTLPMDVFQHIDQLSAPRLVEYWEQDPCSPATPRFPIRRHAAMVYGAPPTPSAKMADHGVKIEAQFAVGEYEILVLSAKESNGLETWLHEHHYTIPKGAAEALAPYVHDQMKFFVAKVDIKKVKKNAQGELQLSPLRVQYESPDLRLPVRLGLLNAAAKQDLIVYVLSPKSRYEVANYPNVFVPTNLDVLEPVKQAFAPFYATLFDAALAPRQGKAVVTEYAWQTSSCDPCPVPPLTPSDLATLGVGGGVAGQSSPETGSANATVWTPQLSAWVLTRLHARYDRTSLSDDLVFKEASAVTGGRSTWNGKSADAGAQPSTVNNFQARYIVRHYWQGAVSCSTPRFDRWGGPPGSGEATGYRPPAAPAQGLANAARGSVVLGDVVQSPVPTLGLPGHAPPHHQ